MSVDYFSRIVQSRIEQKETNLQIPAWEESHPYFAWEPVYYNGSWWVSRVRTRGSRPGWEKGVWARIWLWEEGLWTSPGSAVAYEGKVYIRRTGQAVVASNTVPPPASRAWATVERMRADSKEEEQVEAYGGTSLLGAESIRVSEIPLWGGGGSYSVGDLVRFAGVEYVSLIGFNNWRPDYRGWERVHGWEPEHAYPLGRVVRYGDSFYIRRGTIPGDPEEGEIALLRSPDLSPTYWASYSPPPGD